MSEDNYDDLADIFEALEPLETILVDYDDALSKNEHDPAQIHIIFRNAHNLKGALALAQLENSQRLIHIVEDNFDQIRNGKATLSSELIDKSLKALDIIANSLTQGKEDPEDFNNLMQELEFTEDKIENESILPFKLTAKEVETARTGCKEKSSFFIIEKLIKTSIDKESYSKLPIFKDVKGIGTLVGYRPEWENLNKKSEDDVLRIFYITEKKEDDLFFIIFDPMKLLDKEKICIALSKPKKPETVTGKNSSEFEKLKAAPINLNILIVEDDFITRTLVSKILAKYGHCETAVNGKEAIIAFRNSLREKKLYNLILLDIMIPEIDGEGVLSKIRSLETRSGITGLDRVKIIMVSSISNIETIKHSFTEQSDAYIVKPFTEKKLIREFHHLDFTK